MTESLGDRVKRVIKDARISPRILASVTGLHYTTVYAVQKGDTPTYRTTEHILSGVLDKIEQLVKEGACLPFDATVPHSDRAIRLEVLLNPEATDAT